MDYRPLPAFQPHLQAFLHRREIAEMWIPGSSEAQGLSEGLNDRPFPRHHHIAVCKQETLAFIELPNLAAATTTTATNGRCVPPLESPGPRFGRRMSSSDGGAWPKPAHSTDNWDCSSMRSRKEQSKEKLGQQTFSESVWVRGARRKSGSPPRPPLQMCDSEPHGSEPRSPDLCSPQRRMSQSSDKEKSARRKMRVYSPESLSDESLSSPSLECEYLFPTSAFEDELKGIPPPLPSSRGPTESAVSPPADPSDCFEDMVVAEAAGQAARPGDQERRRFSASELISRLQLSQRKSSFTLKLGKSLSARVTPKEKGGSRSLSPEGRHSGRDRSSAGSADSAPQSPVGPGPVPPGEHSAALHKGPSRQRKDSMEETTCAPICPGYTKRLSRFLPNSILYQEYSDVAINREIQRQQWADAINEEDENGVAPASCNISPTNSFRSQRSSRGSAFSLWQDIPDVRSSGLLDTFSNQERKLQETAPSLNPIAILYQEYSDVAINREIQRQQWADAINEEDENGVAPASCNISPTNSFRSQRSSRGSAFSLWQDIPDVRSSGLLDTFSNQERKLQEAKFELVTSEASYIRSLSIAVDHFMCSRELSDCLGTQERQWLFSKLPDVKDVSERFLSDLEERLEEDILRFDVSDIVLTHCPAFRKVYLPYVTNQAYQEQTYQRLLLENPRFPVILARLEEDPVCQRLPLTSFLILPFQRITRLKMLVENILKRTAPGSKDEDTATKAFNELKKLIKECNSSVQSMKRTEELIHLNKKIHFEGKIFPLISQSRWLVKHGELLEVDTQTISMSGSKLKLPTRPVYLHLFNDYLLLSRKKETGKFAVFVHAKIGGLKVKDLNVKLHGISGYIFHLQICDGQQLKYQILLKALTESEKQRWITAMFPSNLEAGKEHIKENEDLPQVQCIRSYKAQEDDELTLEKADILQAKTITNDGWIEGIRLSDGERGWFPKSYVEEITSRSARLRNLRENNRIKCATQKLEEEYL
ncbi:ARHGJ factor, partial [Polypterus senegalus]|nr:ARHGJ factor [Polypterus senegalus]